MVENKVWWIEDEEYDYDVGTLEYKQAKKKTDLWLSFADELRNRIFDILRAEGVEITEKGQIAVLEPFMERNGFKDSQDWWVKIDKE